MKVFDFVLRWMAGIVSIMPLSLLVYAVVVSKGLPFALSDSEGPLPLLILTPMIIYVLATVCLFVFGIALMRGRTDEWAKRANSDTSIFREPSQDKV